MQFSWTNFNLYVLLQFSCTNLNLHVLLHFSCTNFNLYVLLQFSYTNFKLYVLLQFSCTNLNLYVLLHFSGTNFKLYVLWQFSFTKFNLYVLLHFSCTNIKLYVVLHFSCTNFNFMDFSNSHVQTLIFMYVFMYRLKTKWTLAILIYLNFQVHASNLMSKNNSYVHAILMCIQNPHVHDLVIILIFIKTFSCKLWSLLCKYWFLL